VVVALWGDAGALLMFSAIVALLLTDLYQISQFFSYSNCRESTGQNHSK